MDPIDNIDTEAENVQPPPPPPPPPTETILPPVNEQEAAPPPLWRRIRNFMGNNRVEAEEQDDSLRSDANPIYLLIDRYIHKRLCPYCFSYVTRRVYRESLNHRGRTRVSGVELTRKSIKVYVCPTCKHELPADFFANRSSSIAIVGGTDSGKSSYITVFCELLLNRRTNLSEFGVFGSIVNEEGRLMFEENREQLIFQKRTMLPTRGVKDPIVVCLHSKHHKKVTYLTLIDSQGEVFDKVEDIITHHPNLPHAGGIVFLMNPLDISELFKQMQYNNPDDIPMQRSLEVRNYDIVENLYQTFVLSQKIAPNDKIKIPTAFCISRADMLEDLANVYLQPDFDADLSSPHDILQEVDLITDDLRELLEETDLNLLNLMDKRFKNYSLFPVSPLGSTPVGDAMGASIKGGIDPKGVLQPIIWLLRNTNFIKGHE